MVRSGRNTGVLSRMARRRGWKSSPWFCSYLMLTRGKRFYFSKAQGFYSGGREDGKNMYIKNKWWPLLGLFCKRPCHKSSSSKDKPIGFSLLMFLLICMYLHYFVSLAQSSQPTCLVISYLRFVSEKWWQSPPPPSRPPRRPLRWGSSGFRSLQISLGGRTGSLLVVRLGSVVKTWVQIPALPHWAS